jgi:hypothetical protein
MTWLEPDAWVDACGAPSAHLREPYVERGGEAELAERVSIDPRRCVALVGASGAGTTRLALELARRSAWARYRDPLAPPDPRRDVGELRALVAGDARPVVVVDGPDRAEALSVLAELLAQRLHPRLLVVVPCSDRIARRLAHIAGDYPRASILVAAMAGEGAPPPPLPAGIPHAVLAPLALAGRCDAGAVPGEQQMIDAGLAARHAGSGTVVCLADERRRFEVSREVLLTDEVALTALLDRRPALRRPCFETALRWLGGNLPEPALEHLAAFGADDVPDLADFARRGLLIAPPVLVALVKRAVALLPSTDEPDLAARLRLQIARGVAIAGDEKRSSEHLDGALALPCSPAMRGTLLMHRAVAAVEPELCAEAVDLLRAAGDTDGLRDALQRWVELLRAVGRAQEALVRATEWIALEDESGSAAGAAAARTTASSIAGSAATIPDAIAFAGAAAADSEAIGDIRRQALALYRVASLRGAIDDLSGARAAVERAVACERAIDNRAGEGYAEWMLGALHDRGADPSSAAARYAASIAAYAGVGPVPERLRDALRVAKERAAGMAVPEPGELGPGDELAPEPAEGLVQLRVRDRK